MNEAEERGQAVDRGAAGLHYRGMAENTISARCGPAMSSTTRIFRVGGDNSITSISDFPAHRNLPD
jgi:hypothetical protein